MIYAGVKIWFMGVLLLLLGGCKKFLEHPPDSRASLNTPQAVSQLLGTAYPQANYMNFCESVSDNVTDKKIGIIDQTNHDLFLFKDVKGEGQDSPVFYWNACYAAIAVANQALEVCAKAASPEEFTAQKGEALVARAYAHFMLATFFCAAYDPATAHLHPGIPYVTEPENVVFKQYQRKTIAYVYQMIEQDLLQGIPLLNDQVYTVPRYHFTRVAAHAFASRFYLFKRNYARVIEHAGYVFPGSGVGVLLRPWNTTYRNLTYNELWARYAKAAESANLLLAETSSNWGRNYYRVRYGLTDSLTTRILGRNVTAGTWAFKNQLYTIGAGNYMLPKINEYFVRTSVNAEIGYPYVMVPLLTTEEVLFNRIEAYSHLYQIDKALQDLNTYAGTRIVNYNMAVHAITANKLLEFYGKTNLEDAIVQAVLDFKRAEFVQEGMRWLDILRHRLTVLHVSEGEASLSLGPDDPRRMFQLPASVSASGIELNPR